MLNIVAFDLDLFHYRWIISSLSAPNQWNLSKIPLTCTKRISKIHRKIQEQRYLMNFPGVVNSMFSTRLNLSLRVSHCLYLACVKASRGYLLLESEKDYSISASQTKGKKLKNTCIFSKSRMNFHANSGQNSTYPICWHHVD